MISQPKDADQTPPLDYSNVPIGTSDREHEAAELTFSFARDPKFDAWQKKLKSLPLSEAFIREAKSDPKDGLRMSDLQNVCDRMPIFDAEKNASIIAERTVLLAEIDSVHVGYCISSPGPKDSDPLYIREVAVVLQARKRGIALDLLTKAAKKEPERNIVLATQDDNTEAQALNAKFAKLLGASIGRVKLGTYRDSDLGIKRGDGYRSWVIQRLPLEP